MINKEKFLECIPQYTEWGWEPIWSTYEKKKIPEGIIHSIILEKNIKRNRYSKSDKNSKLKKELKDEFDANVAEAEELSPKDPRYNELLEKNRKILNKRLELLRI